MRPHKCRRRNIKPLDPWPHSSIVRGVHYSPLTTLRLSAAGSPSLRALSKLIGCSPSAVSLFEVGRQPLSAEMVKKYARAIGASDRAVRKAFLLSRMSYYRRALDETRRMLTELGIPAPGGRGRDLAKA